MKFLLMDCPCMYELHDIGLIHNLGKLCVKEVHNVL